VTSRPLDILVVDDDPDARDLVARAVRLLGHTSRTAGSGLDALAMLREQHADVIISDWNMPGMNGAELCRQTRVVDDEAPYTYFILMSGYDDRSHVLGGMNAGADDYQAKPIDLDELEARLVSAARVIALHERLAERTAALRTDSRNLYVVSRTDPLTSAANRLALDEELEGIRIRAQRYHHHHSLAMFDVDGFKTFNDHFGHLAGDDALRRIVEVMRATIRSSDGLYRYGGEELVVLFHEQTLPEAEAAAGRVRRAVEALSIPTWPRGVLTISAGVAEVRAGDRSVGDWIARADAALYRAKANGRNCVDIDRDRSDTVSPQPREA
jgi:diguanylate cyclase (GGDEF)-like protein